MVNNAIVTKNTGWQTPQQVSQYSKYGQVNTYTCYAYSNIERIKTRDGICAYIPHSGGVNKAHKSARVYCSGFGFNIPNDATITKVLVRQRRCMGTYTYNSTYIQDEAIRLKTGASTSDFGVGNNLSEGARWNVKSKGLGEYTVGDKSGTVQEVWGVKVTPTVTNNQNFGCVVQCVGTAETWHDPWIDCVEMCIYYTQVNDSRTDSSNVVDNTKSEEKAQSVQIESKVVTEYQPDDSDVLQATQGSISEDYVYTPFNLWIRYRNYVDEASGVLLDGYNGVITIYLDEFLRFSDGSRSLKIPAFEFKENTDTKDIQRGYKTKFKELEIYPVKAGTGKVTINGVYYTKNDEVVKSQVLYLRVDKSITSLHNSMCTIKNTRFTNCNATKGSAIYNLGALTFNDLNFVDLSDVDKCFFDYDKYRDSEFR